MASCVFTFGNGSTKMTVLATTGSKTYSVAVESYCDSSYSDYWCISQADWIDVTCNETGITFTVAANTGAATSPYRECTLEFEQISTEKTIKIRVLQNANEYYTFGFESGDTTVNTYPYQAKVSGVTFYVDIESLKHVKTGSSWNGLSASWDVDSSTIPNWATFTKIQDEIDPDSYSSVKVTVARNTSSNSRQAYVKFTQPNSGLYGYMILTQDTPTNVYEFHFSNDARFTAVTASSGASTVTIPITSTLNGVPLGYTADVSSDFMTATAGETALTLTFTVNKTNSARSTAFWVIQDTTHDQMAVMVTQNPGIGTDCTFTIMGQTAYTLSDISPLGRAVVAPINSVCSGTKMPFDIVSHIPDWITNVGKTNDSISGRVTANNSKVDNTERECEITLCQNWATPDKYIKITLIQKAGVHYDCGIVSGSSTPRTVMMTVDRAAVTAQYALKSIKYTPSGNDYTETQVGFTIQSKPDWVTISSLSSSSVTLSIAANTGAQRGGTIELKQDETTYINTFNITQNGDDSYIGNVPLTIVPEEERISLALDLPLGETMSASTDGGSTWMEACRKCIIESDNGFGIKLRGKFVGAVPHIEVAGKFSLSGSVFSLVYGNEFTGQTQMLSGSTFQGLFSGNTGLLSAMKEPNKELFLGNSGTIMRPFCYARMFAGCTNLSGVPFLSSVTMAYGCYEEMFSGCKKIGNISLVLPNTNYTLAPRCFYGMFRGCNKLQAPRLYAQSLVEDCYNSMFAGCDSGMTVMSCKASQNLNIDRCTSNWVKGVKCAALVGNDCSLYVKTGTKAQWDEKEGNDGIPNNFLLIESSN